MPVHRRFFPVADLTINKLKMNCLSTSADSREVHSVAGKPKAFDPAIRDAAASLARRPRGSTRRWTGFINGEWTWRGREIELPDGTRAFIYGALRGKVVWSRDPICLPGGQREVPAWGALPGSAVQFVKNPFARLLGSQKRGVRERPSPAKTEAARVNGRKPPRPGSRPRGRPRRWDMNLGT